jgi:hypothetical protein
VSKSDLDAYADVLDTPISLKYCAKLVMSTPGGITSMSLGVGASKAALLGHINQATLHLGCSLDPNDPYILDPGGGECSDPTNIPEPLAEQQSQGTITAGAVTVVGPGVDALATITNGTLATREILNADGSVDFMLTAFDVALPNATAGVFELREVEISLAAPASATLVDQTVSFAPGTLRFAVTAAVFVDGRALGGGQPMTAVYANSETATAIRGLDGTFEFVDATVSLDTYTVTLATPPTALRSIP